MSDRTPLTTHPNAAPAYMHSEIAARIAYAQLPLALRLTTPPPDGWDGAWAARVVSRCAALIRWRAVRGGGDQ